MDTDTQVYDSLYLYFCFQKTSIMKIIIPMAGMGTRLRPHTLTTPKPLLKITGKPIVEILIQDLASMMDETIEEIAFVIGDFGKEVEDKLLEVARKLGSKGSIYYQKQALGTAHAIYCAAPSLSGKVLVAYADTLFKASIKINPEEEACIWVKKIEDPSQFGVVVTDSDRYIQQFVEKPATPVSNLAIIGIYYFREAEILKSEIEYLLNNNITGNGEYQITDALENMKKKKLKFKAVEVDDWYDCGNKGALLETQRKLLADRFPEGIDRGSLIQNSRIIQPCFIGKNVRIVNSEIGPFVGIEDGTIIENSRLENTLVYENAEITGTRIKNSIIGNNCKLSNVENHELSIGDYSRINA